MRFSGGARSPFKLKEPVYSKPCYRAVAIQQVLALSQLLFVADHLGDDLVRPDAGGVIVEAGDDH